MQRFLALGKELRESRRAALWLGVEGKFWAV